MMHNMHCICSLTIIISLYHINEITYRYYLLDKDKDKVRQQTACCKLHTVNFIL